MAAPSKQTLKLLIDKNANKVLFAEAGKETVDFLCNILTLPVGTVISLLSDQQETVGSLSNLYQSIENLNDDYIQPNQHKDTILKPTVYNSIEQSPLLMITDVTQKKSETVTDQLYMCGSTFLINHHYVTNMEGTICPSCHNTMIGKVIFVEGKNVKLGTTAVGGDRLYMCSRKFFINHHYVTNMEGTICPSCHSNMNKEVIFVDGKNVKVGSTEVGGGGGGGGFVRGMVTYMVMDDLEVTPMSTITGITLLNKFNVKDVGALEEKVVHLDMAKGWKLLKTSFQSKNVLTEVFL